MFTLLIYLEILYPFQPLFFWANASIFILFISRYDIQATWFSWKTKCLFYSHWNQTKTTVKKENIKIGHELSVGGSTDWLFSILEWTCRGDLEVRDSTYSKLQNVQLQGTSTFPCAVLSCWDKAFPNMNEDLTRTAALHGMIQKN